MKSDEELIEGARRFADSLQAPVGRITFDKAVRCHLDWLVQVRRRGLSWNQIIELLRQTGVTRDDGRPLARSHLSAVYSRQMRRTGWHDKFQFTNTDDGADKVGISAPRAFSNEAASDREKKARQQDARQPTKSRIPSNQPITATSNAANERIKSFMARAAKQRNSHD